MRHRLFHAVVLFALPGCGSSETSTPTATDTGTVAADTATAADTTMGTTDTAMGTDTSVVDSAKMDSAMMDMCVRRGAGVFPVLSNRVADARGCSL
jgi:hypothetical protein